MHKLLSRLLVRLVQYFKTQEGDFVRYGDQNFWQGHGFSIIPNHYYSPLPSLDSLEHAIFTRASQLIGINMREKDQISFLGKLSHFFREVKNFSYITSKVDGQKDPRFYFGNLAFDNLDAGVYYALIRYLEPRLVVEVGSGWSTKIAAVAALKNKTTKLVSIEPYPQPILKKGFPGLSRLIEKKIEDVPFSFFEALGDGDILFIDSSHTVKTGGDVNYLFFEILPRLKKGVWVHIHDIFLPWEYPEVWVRKEFRFWNEQYLLHSFLMFNESFRVEIANSFLATKHNRLVKSLLSGLKNYGGGSFWIRKVR